VLLLGARRRSAKNRGEGDPIYGSGDLQTAPMADLPAKVSHSLVPSVPQRLGHEEAKTEGRIGPPHHGWTETPLCEARTPDGETWFLRADNGTRIQQAPSGAAARSRSRGLGGKGRRRPLETPPPPSPGNVGAIQRAWLRWVYQLLGSLATPQCRCAQDTPLWNHGVILLDYQVLEVFPIVQRQLAWKIVPPRVEHRGAIID
jgi:hypothetical protein